MSWFSKDILALDWDHRQLRVVSGRVAQGKAVVRGMFQESLPADVTGEDPVAFGRWLKAVLSQHGCQHGRTLMAIPRDQVVLKTLLLPANTPPLELPALVQFQMQKELPFAIDDAVIDYSEAGEPSNGQQAPATSPGPQVGIELPLAGGQKEQARPEPATREYLVAATRKEVIDFYRKVAEAAELDLHRVGLRCFSNVQIVRSCAPRDINRRLLLVNVGPELTEIDIIRGGGLLFSRSASVALNEREDPTEFLNRLTLEVIRSAQAARATVADLELDGCVVAAPDWLASSIAERLAQRLDVRGWVLEPGRSGELKMPAKQGEGAGEFCAALGLVLGQTRTSRPPFDFLHPHKPVDLVALRQQKRRTVLIAAAAAVIFLVAGNYIALTLTDKTQGLNAQATKLEREKKRVETKAEEIEAINMFSRSPLWVDEIEKIDKMWMARERGKPSLHENAFVSLFHGKINKDGWQIQLKGAAKHPNVVTVDVRERLDEKYPPPFRILRDKAPVPVGGQTFGHVFDETIRFVSPSVGEKRK